MTLSNIDKRIKNIRLAIGRSGPGTYRDQLERELDRALADKNTLKVVGR